MKTIVCSCSLFQLFDTWLASPS